MYLCTQYFMIKYMEAVKKNVYQHPMMRIVKIHQTQMLCDTSVQSNVGLKFGGGSTGEARSRQENDWEDWQ